MCAEEGIDPVKTFSGKFNVRVPPELHAELVLVATAEGKSLNQWVVEALDREAHA